MTENTGKLKINEAAKAVARSTRESLQTISDLQGELTNKMNAMRKRESELVKRAREEQEKQEQLAREAAATAEEKKEAPAVAEQPKTPELQKQTAPQEPSVSPAKTESVEQKEAVQPSAKEAAPVEKTQEQAKSEQKAEPAAPPQPVAPQPAQPQQPPVRMERPAERLARQQGRILRDDAAIRNAARMAEEAKNRPPQQRDSRAQMGGNRSNNNGRPGGYPPRDGQRPNHASRPGGDRNGRPNNGYNQQRPGGNRNGRPGGAAAIPPVMPAANKKGKVSNYDPNKSSYTRVFDNEKRNKSRKALEKERTAAMLMAGDDDMMVNRKRKRKVQQPVKIETVKIEKAVITGDTVMIKTLAERIGKPASEIIKKCMMLGIIATINNEIDFDTASLVASELGVELEQKIEQTAEDVLTQDMQDEDEKDLQKRPPVVTIMGHVDHGKTSLLDKIRSTRVTAGEAGGITQHIGAYTVEINDESITFLDTPGHEAFTSMRARGAQVTDAVILVVAADDGIMPQTVEAINHAKAAEVPIIVAINKIDKEGANPERVKQELTEHGLVSEDWGGDTIVVPISARTGEGIDKLLEMVLLVAEIQELKANPNRMAKGTIIEAKLDKGRGPVATVLVQTGTLRVGNTVIAGTASGRIRAMINDKGQKVEEALPSTPVEVLGFDFVPEAGDILYAVEASGLTRQIVEERKNKLKAEQMKMTARVSLDELFEQISEGEIKDLNIIVKADVQGSVEAVRSSLEKLSNDKVRVRCIHGGAGAIALSDVVLASASNAIIIGFNVRPDTQARITAERENVDIRLYRVIYNAIEDVEKAMKGLLEPVYEEVALGQAKVRETFKISSIGTIAGCMVQEGKLTRNADVRLLRDNVVIYEGKLASLKRFKDDAREVLAGFECGLSLQNYNDIKEGDIIEAFTQQEVEQ